MMKTLRGEDFLKWFSALNYLPLINPQTFQLDLRKRVDTAIENLESFDYVVPYNEIDLFINEVAPHVKIVKKRKEAFPFSIKTLKNDALVQNFIAKDIALYQTASSLWETSKTNNFKPIVEITGKNRLTSKANENKYAGIVDNIKSNFISGWVFHKEKEESITVNLYINDILQETVKADIMRPGVKKNRNHPTGLCGFEFVFEENILHPADKIKIKPMDDDIIIQMSEKCQNFFKND